MKVLITTDWYRPVINGVVTSVLDLSEGLTAMGHEVRILTLSGSIHSYREGSVTFIGSVSVGMDYPNARLRTARGEALVRELIDWRPDVVHSQCEFSTFAFARRIANACGCPLVHTYHTVYEDFTHYFSPNVRFGRFLAAAFSRHVLAQTAAVIVPTEKIRTMLRGYGVTQPISTVPTGLKLAPFLAPMPCSDRAALRKKLGLAESDLTLIYIGRLAREKNISELLAFLPAAPREVKLLLVGDGPYRSELENEVRTRGLADRVIFAGMVEPARVADYYKAGDVFVSASQSETQGLTYIEAMAAGLPLLCRRDDCLNGVLSPNENGFAYTTETEFLSAIGALQSAGLRERLGAAAQALAADRFSEEGFARAALAVYEGCLVRAAEASAA